MREKAFRIIISGLAILLIVQLLRAMLFAIAGWGAIPLGIATLSAHYSAIAAAGVMIALMLMRAKRKALALSQMFPYLVCALMLIPATYAFAYWFPGKVFFSQGFEYKLRQIVKFSELQAWAEQTLSSTNDAANEMNIDLTIDHMPHILRSVRKSNHPRGTVFMHSDEARWLFIVIKWREAFSEFGLRLTPRTNCELDRDARFRKQAPGIYTFYE